MSSTRAGILFGSDLDTAAWARRHAAGEVPDAFPYGLDHLSRHGFAVEGPGPATRARQRLRGAVRRLGGGMDWVAGGSARSTADVVLAWDERIGVPYALLHRSRPPVVVNVIWATDTDASAPVRRAVTAGLRRADRVFVLSSGQVPGLRGRYGVPPGKIDVVPFGVDAAFFTPGAAEDVDRDLVLSVGNDRDRDFTTVLRAFAAVRQRRPSTRLVLVTRRVSPETVTGLPGVELLPHLGHAPLGALLRRAALTMTLTRPNLHASGVTASLESMAAGRPALATANPGMDDYGGGGDALQLLPPGDADAAAAAALTLLLDPAAADARGAAGRREVEQRFSTERQAGHLAEVLRRTLADA